MPICSIRQDLIEKNVFVPLVRNGQQVYIRSSKEFEFRFVNRRTPQEQFQIKYYDEWLDAYIIDFQF